MRWSALLSFAFALCKATADARYDLEHLPVPALTRRDDTLPPCSLECIVSLAPKYGCQVTDAECLCTNANLTTALGACVLSKCSVIDALATQKYQTISCGKPTHNEGPLSRRVLWALFAVSVASIGLRFIARAPWFNGPGFGMDDYTMLLVLASIIPLEISVEIMIRNGLGQDLWMVEPDDIETFLKFWWSGEMCYSFAVVFTKVAILFLYLRIIPSSVSTWFRRACYTLIGLCIAAAIGMILSLVFECTPINGAWTQWNGTRTAKCINFAAQGSALASVNILMDLTVFILPIPRMLKLNTSNQKKIGICMTFSVGLFVTIVSIVRLVEILKSVPFTNPTSDFTTIVIWTQAEVNVGVLCACMPAFAGLIKRCWAATIGTSIKSISNKQYNSAQPESSRRLGSVPSDGVAKTVDTTVVFNKRVDSSDEVELMDRSSQKSLESGFNQHKYTREWEV